MYKVSPKKGGRSKIYPSQIEPKVPPKIKAKCSLTSLISVYYKCSKLRKKSVCLFWGNSLYIYLFNHTEHLFLSLTLSFGIHLPPWLPSSHSCALSDQTQITN